jgi:hypothetical protein
LAKEQSGSKYWSSNTLIKFLELPDALGSGAVVYRLCSYLGAFPFSNHALENLTSEALLRVVCFMTGRYMRVLPSEKGIWTKEIWRGCVVLNQETSATKKNETDAETSSGSNGGEELAFRVFELVGAAEVFKQSEQVDIQSAMIVRDDLLKLLELLIVIAPHGPTEPVSLYTAHLDERRLESLRTVANCILASFGPDQNLGVTYEAFDTVVINALPHMFDSLAPLFEKFLLPNDYTSKDSIIYDVSSLPVAKIPLPIHGEILDIDLLSQLSFVISDKSIFHRLRPLYLSHNHGYSMGSFEKMVFGWQAASLLLVSGRMLSPTNKQGSAKVFMEDLPHRRLSSSVTGRPYISTLLESSESAAEHDHNKQSLIYGAYIPVPWQATDKATFGTDKTTLFQLAPFHDVFPASSLNQNYIYFNKPPSTYPGIGFGSPLPNYNSMTHSQQLSGEYSRRSSVTSYSASDTAYVPGSVGRSSFSGQSSPEMMRRSLLLGDEHLPLGPVSLHIDDALQFGVFTHLASAGGSTFQSSKLAPTARPSNSQDWQDRFEIDAIEVWGVENANFVRV